MKDSNGESVKVIISDTTIDRVVEEGACEGKLAELIKTMKAEIAEMKKAAKA